MKSIKQLFESAMKASVDEILDNADIALARALDGGDPMDAIGNWMDERHVNIHTIDELVNKTHKVKGGLYGYIARAWREHAEDRAHDAKISVDKIKKRIEKHGDLKRYGGTHAFSDLNNNFVAVDKDGNVTIKKNPWGKEG